MTKTERKLTHEQRYTRETGNNSFETITFWNVDDVEGDVYVTDSTYTIVLKNCIMFDKELDVDEFDEILETLHNNKTHEDGWEMYTEKDNVTWTEAGWVALTETGRTWFIEHEALEIADFTYLSDDEDFMEAGWVEVKT